MKPRTVEEVLPVMEDMIRLELSLAALYQACAERFPEDGELWPAIQRQEEEHARSIRALADLIAAHPEEFSRGRPFNSVATRTMLASVAGYTDQVRKGQLARQRVLILTRDLENSVLEASYGEIVTTRNLEYGRIINRIHQETLSHKKAFAAELARLRG